VITFNSRGYPPSDVPADPGAYSEATLVEDLAGLLRYLGIGKAHIAGLSMGGGVALNFGLRHPEACASLVVASAGAGSTDPERFRRDGSGVVEKLGREGIAGVQDFFFLAPARLTFREKDPRGWEKARNQMAEHSALGARLTFSRVQLERPSILSLEEELKTLALPTLILVGDRDEACMAPALFMRRCLPHAGLLVFPRSGHAINLEEPDLFNRAVLRFLASAEAGKWT
jgi:pimeloyl-ACP methyl ester carboxylesterase